MRITDLAHCFEQHTSYFENNKAKISKCIEMKLQEGVMEIPHDETFWRLSK